MRFDEIAATIEMLEARRYDAMLTRDVAALSTLLAEDMVYIHPDGKTDNKKSYSRLIASGQLIYHKIDRTKPKQLQVDDRIVFITGKMTAEITWFGTPKKLENRYILSWVRALENWHLLTWQSTGLSN